MTGSTAPTRRDILRQRHAEYARTRDPRLRDELVAAHENLCRSLAGRFAGGRDTFEDLCQQAEIGLLNALERFDPSRGVEFSTFAWTTISGELKRYLRDCTWRVHVPRRVQEMYLTAVAEADDLRVQLGREPTHAEVAARCVTSEATLDQALEAESARRPASLDALAADRPVAEADEALQRVEDRELIERLMTGLSERSRAIVRLHLLLGLSQREVGRRLGLSQVHVSRLAKEALEALQARAGQLAPV
jgi:RNA polymerase sigma-B factor